MFLSNAGLYQKGVLVHIQANELHEVDFALKFLEAWRRKHVHVEWRFGPVSEVRVPASHPSKVTPFRQGDYPVAQIITDSQQVTASVAFKDKKGNAAAVENPVWSVSDAALLSAEADAADASGLTATIKAVGPIGSGQVSLTVDSLVGEGESQLVATADVQIVAGQAVVGEFSFGTPSEQA